MCATQQPYLEATLLLEIDVTARKAIFQKLIFLLEDSNYRVKSGYSITMEKLFTHQIHRHYHNGAIRVCMRTTCAALEKDCLNNRNTLDFPTGG